MYNIVIGLFRNNALRDITTDVGIARNILFRRKFNQDQPHGAPSEYQGFIGDEAAKPRNKGRKKKFIWKLTGYSECTKTCGGGNKPLIFIKFNYSAPYLLTRINYVIYSYC